MQQGLHCPNCGSPVASGARFCSNCGTSLSWPTQQQMEPPPAYQEGQQPRGWSGEPGGRVQGSRWDFLKAGGRFSRLQFAFFYFIPIVVGAGLGAILGYGDGFLFAAAGVLIWLWVPFQIYVVIVAGIRRLHDLGRSGWYLLLAFIPLLNVVMLLYLIFAPGVRGG